MFTRNQRLTFAWLADVIKVAAEDYPPEGVDPDVFKAQVAKIVGDFSAFSKGEDSRGLVARLKEGPSSELVKKIHGF